MTASNQHDYTQWSNADLVARVTVLERQLRAANVLHEAKCMSSSTNPAMTSKRIRPERQFDHSRYSTRLIALKLAYLGQCYNGYEYHANTKTRLPTIEEHLWQALAKAKLISPTSGTEGEINWEGCEYSKCGRTDKGVSAFGQVVGLRVRSARPLRNGGKEAAGKTGEETEEVETSEVEFDDIQDELEYPRMLNRLLPDDIRILAWCPAPTADFSARFSCRERRYRYFFTQPAYSPRPGTAGLDSNGHREGWLDINAMQEAAKHFQGLNDFRNFCKIDGSKQITNFERHIFSAGIHEEVQSSMPDFVHEQMFGPVKGTEVQVPKVYCFTVNGSAFLWHQVRHMAAVLFLVGQGREQPSIVQKMLDINETPSKPMYEMADDAPLVLWDCIFPAEGDDPRRDALPWVYPHSQADYRQSPSFADGCYGPGGTNEVLWTQWRRRKIDEILAGGLLNLVSSQHAKVTASPGEILVDDISSTNVRRSTKVFDGGNTARLRGEYVPLMQRQRMDLVEVQNQRYAVRKGLSSLDASTSTVPSLKALDV